VLEGVNFISSSEWLLTRETVHFHALIGVLKRKGWFTFANAIWLGALLCCMCK